MKNNKLLQRRNSSKILSESCRNTCRCQIDTPNTHDRSLSWLGTDTSVNSDRSWTSFKGQNLPSMSNYGVMQVEVFSTCD